MPIFLNGTPYGAHQLPRNALSARRELGLPRPQPSASIDLSPKVKKEDGTAEEQKFLSCVLAMLGCKASKSWMEHHFVPTMHSSLYVVRDLLNALAAGVI